ncbi:hypothetical protein GIY23_13635 [Allosaccharopolyspora coralli]|uniref:PH domain-containing protein n=1 Tax=Allosaccharopolyspora coralli TaxID=2665642 RepID=A0A5Q3QFW3_9PSEU|nr:hypothetical protein [Allosaccharopolyspora coralli]QGK70425.1 hypothetical protein GIY23_13635 [Allosaccharopolyspora coralli]
MQPAPPATSLVQRRPDVTAYVTVVTGVLLTAVVVFGAGLLTDLPSWVFGGVGGGSAAYAIVWLRTRSHVVDRSGIRRGPTRVELDQLTELTVANRSLRVRAGKRVLRFSLAELHADPETLDALRWALADRLDNSSVHCDTAARGLLTGSVSTDGRPTLRWMWWAGVASAALSLGANVAGFVDPEMYSMPSGIVVVTIAFVIVFLLGWSVAWLFLLRAAGQGRGWARSVAVVAAALWILSSLSSFTGPDMFGGVAADVLMGLCAIAVLVVLLLLNAPEAQAAQRERERSPGQ